jgi:hypothetical protein
LIKEVDRFISVGNEINSEGRIEKSVEEYETVPNSVKI